VIQAMHQHYHSRSIGGYCQGFFPTSAIIFKNKRSSKNLVV
jgi:hypothetical protein